MIYKYSIHLTFTICLHAGLLTSSVSLFPFIGGVMWGSVWGWSKINSWYNNSTRKQQREKLNRVKNMLIIISEIRIYDLLQFTSWAKIAMTAIGKSLHYNCIPTEGYLVFKKALSPLIWVTAAWAESVDCFSDERHCGNATFSSGIHYCYFYFCQACLWNLKNESA